MQKWPKTNSKGEAFFMEGTPEKGPRARHEARAAPKSGQSLNLRMPTDQDGPGVSALIACSPPLDLNSAYCNLLQCSDFAETCMVAERDYRLLGWISAYRPPAARERLFIWQVAIDPAARGEGLATRMLDALLERPSVAGATTLTTTITEGNTASWALFEAFARRHGARLTKTLRFARDAHFAGAHDTEWEARVAPLPSTPTS
jgi:L-2,4-diaminobutyric acid acetyltransferase